MKPGEDIYPKAREILCGEPTMGKKRLTPQERFANYKAGTKAA